MTNLAALIIITLHTNMVVTETHHAVYTTASGQTVSNLVYLSVVTNSPSTNVVAKGRIVKYSNLTGMTNGDTAAIGVMAPPSLPHQKFIRTNGVIVPVFPMPNNLRTSSIAPMPPLPGPPAPTHAMDIAAQAGVQPFTTNWFTLITFRYNYAISDYLNFQPGHTYQLQLGASPIAGPWHVSDTEHWDFSTNDYWRVSQATSGPSSNPAQYVRFHEVLP